MEQNKETTRKWFVSASSMSNKAVVPGWGIVVEMPAGYSPATDDPDNGHPFPKMRREFVRTARELTVPIQRIGYDDSRINIIGFYPFEF